MFLTSLFSIFFIKKRKEVQSREVWGGLGTWGGSCDGVEGGLFSIEFCFSFKVQVKKRELKIARRGTLAQWLERRN